MNTRNFHIGFDRTLRILLSGVAAAWLTVVLPAQEKKEINLSGNWIMTFKSPNGDTIESFLTLKQEGEQLTGTASNPNGMPSPLEEGKVTNDDVSFIVNRMRNNRKITAKYSGKIEGEAIKGKFESNFGGQPRTIEFSVVRDKEPVGATGTWRWSFLRDEGDKVDFTLRLMEEDAKLTGVSISASGNENPITDGVSKDDMVSFKVIRERDDQKFTTKFHGKRDGDTIRGKIETDWTGEPRTYDWEAKRQKRRR